LSLANTIAHSTSYTCTREYLVELDGDCLAVAPHRPDAHACPINWDHVLPAPSKDLVRLRHALPLRVGRRTVVRKPFAFHESHTLCRAVRPNQDVPSHCRGRITSSFVCPFSTALSIHGIKDPARGAPKFSMGRPGVLPEMISETDLSKSRIEARSSISLGSTLSWILPICSSHALN